MTTPITITRAQAQAILRSPVFGAYGSAERIKLMEDIQDAFKGDAENVELLCSKQELKAWAAGCIAGWSQETISTQRGPMAMADGDRNLLRLSAKALRVWGEVAKALPKVEVDDSFEVDPELGDELELDEEAS